MPSLLDTSVSALLTYQRGLNTTGHNIANASTPGFSRQRVDFATRQPENFGNGFVGNGVFARDVDRITNKFINFQILDSTTETARLSSFAAATQQIDSLLADGQGGISPLIQNFFGSLQDIANDPGAAAPREVFLTEAENLIQRFNFLDSQLNEQNNNVNEEVTELVNEANRISRNIAQLNENIISLSNNNATVQPNDLLDQRDELIRQLSEIVSVSTVEGDNGALNVFIGNGQSLVFDTSVQELTTVPNPANFSEINIGYLTNNGPLDITAQISGGEIGGLLDFRREIVSATRNELGQIALVLADSLNTQHRQGLDLNNNLGSDLFTVPTPNIIDNQNNTGGATVSATITDTSAIVASDYQLSFDGANFTLTRLKDNTSVSGAGPLSLDGLDVSIAGAAAAGDFFLIQPTQGAAGNISLLISDTDAIAAANPIRTEADIANIGNASVTFGQVLDVTDTDFLDSIEITFNNPPTSFDIVNVTDTTVVAAGVPYVDGGNIDYNGLRVSISGTPEAGDRFRSEQNSSGISDNRNALSLAGLQTQNLIENTRSFQESYAASIGRIGSLSRQAEVNSGAQTRLLEQVLARREQISGVNLDEEAANLVRFQQVYQAAAQAISVSDTLFQTILVAVRS